jgi:glycosyltransferase involved in cell wall biosynthesis
MLTMFSAKSGKNTNSAATCMRRLLIAVEYLFPFQNSTGYIWSRIIESVKNEAFNFEILAPSTPVKYESFEGNTALLIKAKKQLALTASLALKILLASHGQTTLLTGTNPALLLCLLPFLKRLRKFEWFLLVHDVFPDNLVAAGILQKNSILAKSLGIFFRWVYSSADLSICIGRDMQYVIDAKTFQKTESVYLPNWVDERDVYPLPRMVGHLGFENYIVFQFFGNIGRMQGVPTLLKAINMVTAQNAAFLFIGGGALASEVQQFIYEHPSVNIAYLGPLPSSDRNCGLSMCDVALVSLESKMFGLGVPSKAYFSLAAGRPILAAVDAQSEIGQLLSEHASAGWRCDPGSEEQIAAMIDTICASPSMLQQANPRDVFLGNYSEKLVLRKLMELLRHRLVTCPADYF